MEPRIQYAKTSDGVSIAYWTLGEGMPLIQMPPVPWGDIQLDWQVPEFRAWYERLAEKRMLVQYDGRGTGLSERDVTGFSLDAYLLDLRAVLDHLDLERCALWGIVNSGPPAIAFTARHPERVSHLVLWCSYARASDLFASPRMQSLNALVDEDWELFTETLMHWWFGWSAGEPARRYAALMHESVTPEAYRAALGAIAEFDVRALLTQVKVPTLVLHRRQLAWLGVDVARHLATRIPDARLAVLEGASGGYAVENAQAVLQAINEFLGEGEEAAGETPETGAFRTVLFTDVEGSTALTERLGDAKARELLREHERMVREALKAHGGSEVKTTGDGFMTSFSSATRALESAIAMQRAFAAHNQSAAEPILVRVGLNAGEPIAEDEDLFGTAVNLAARICGHAEAGQILASNVVQELAAGKGFLFADQGEAALKGFDEPVRLFEVRWQDA